MPEQIPGSVEVLDSSNKVGIQLDATQANKAFALLGNATHAGVVALTDQSGKENLRATGQGGQIRLGGNGSDGDLFVMPGNPKDPTDNTLASIHLGGAAAVVQVGTATKPGRLVLRDGAVANRVILEADPGYLLLQKADGTSLVQIGGAQNPAAKLWLFNAAGKETLAADGAAGTLHVGGNGQAGQILVLDDKGKTAVTITGDKGGDLTLSGADCAEEFDATEECEPGTVVVMGDDERLHAASVPYDRRVAGVLSGAGCYRPALVLDKRESRTGRKAIALVGKVFCRVDAREKPISVGDLLTTSATRGHAMKADDPQRAFGAVLGKALRPCASGMGLIPILVALQ